MISLQSLKDSSSQLGSQLFINSHEYTETCTEMIAGIINNLSGLTSDLKNLLSDFDNIADSVSIAPACSINSSFTEVILQVVDPEKNSKDLDIAEKVWSSLWFELTKKALDAGIDSVRLESSRGVYEFTPRVVATTREFRSRLLIQTQL